MLFLRREGVVLLSLLLLAYNLVDLLFDLLLDSLLCA